jgi:hypothetical protein
VEETNNIDIDEQMHEYDDYMEELYVSAYEMMY